MKLIDEKISKGEVYQEFMSRGLNAKSKFEGKLMFDRNYYGSIKTVTFQLTEDCNLACTYCYQINKSKNKLKIETAKKFIDMFIEESYNPNSEFYYKIAPGIVIEFIGGEPLLETKLMDEIYDYFRNQLISKNHPWALYSIISTISNGVNYELESTQKFLRKNKDLLSFSISLDGNKELHDSCRVFHNGKGSYDIAERACIHYMENYDDTMFTKMTIAPENLPYLFDAIVNMIKLGYKQIHANCIYEDKWCLEDAKLLYKQCKKITDYLFENNLQDTVEITLFEYDYFKPYSDDNDKNYCGSSCSMIALDKDGNIFPCIRFMKSSLGNDITPYKIGSVTDGIAVKEDDKKRFEDLYSITRTSQSSDKCNNCPIGIGCGWCTALNYQMTGSVNKRIMSICEMHQARSLANVYFWNKYYKHHKSDKIFKMHIPKDWALNIISEDEYNYLLELSK